MVLLQHIHCKCIYACDFDLKLIKFRLVSLSLDCTGELGQGRFVRWRVEFARQVHEGLIQGAPVQSRHLTQPDLENNIKSA